MIDLDLPILQLQLSPQRLLEHPRVALDLLEDGELLVAAALGVLVNREEERGRPGDEVRQPSWGCSLLLLCGYGCGGWEIGWGGRRGCWGGC